jgi:hypothetical protein
MSGIVQGLIGSLAGVLKDAFWSSVTMLLPGDGVNGAQNNTFIDASTNNFTITRNGNTTQGTFSPFTAAAPYSASTKGGSGYFDGTGDYLTVADNAALQFGTGDFTIEGWVYLTSSTDNVGFVSKRSNSTFTGSDWRIAYRSSTAKITWADAGTGGGATEYATPAISLNTWTHIAFTRSGTTIYCFAGGVLGDSGTVSTNIANTQTFYVGANTTSLTWPGFIANVRVLKGTAVYTAGFTPPTSPLTAITNTSLLLNFTNAGIIDNSMLNVLETVGNAQISTAQSKFGGSSMLFDGTGDYLTIPNSALVNLPGDFTLELWINPSATTGAVLGLGDYRATNNGFSLYFSTNKLRLFVNGADVLSGASNLSTSTWTHVAVVRNGSGANNMKLYLNGTQDAQATVTTSFVGVAANGMVIGTDYGGSFGASAYNGYIDDFRITKGVARYTTTFTPPAAAFPTS